MTSEAENASRPTLKMTTLPMTSLPRLRFGIDAITSAPTSAPMPVSVRRMPRLMAASSSLVARMSETKPGSRRW